MTVQLSKQKKVKTFIVASIIIILVGVASFVLAYGLSEGWDVVAKWFVSKSAILLYIVLGCYGLLVLWILLRERISKL